MAPIRKSKNLNQLSFKDSKYSASKDAANGDNSCQHEREASDMLGSQWSDDELQRFYRAYKKYGKNWKKVAGFVRKRSVEMVEALYKLNKAYLSLPNGTAAGLISMMNDYYNMTDSDECERESNKKLKITQRSQKQDVGKRHSTVSKSSSGLSPSMLHPRATSASNGCLSSSKNRRSGGDIPRVVGRRTPRFPVSHSYNKDEVGKFLSPSKSNSEEGANADEVAQGDFALTKVLERRSCSQMPKRKAEHMSQLPVRNSGAIGDFWEGNLGTDKAGNKNTARGSTNTIKASKRNKLHRKKSNPQYTRSYYDAPGEVDKPKKRSKQLLSEDERAALDALNILADSLPNMEATSTAESGSEEDGDNQTLAEEDSVLEVAPIPEEKQSVHHSTSRLKRRNCTSLSSMIPDDDLVINCLRGKRQKTQGKSAPQESASRGDLQKQGNDLSLPTEQVPTVKQFHLSENSRKRKMPQKRLTMDRLKFQENTGNDSVHNLQKKLFNCLSSESLQRWCGYEWFYSPMDYPWFMKREFMEYLNHVGLGHVKELTRVEWGVIRSSLGKPRRLSHQFLMEERDKLQQYRESVRDHYTQLRSGIVEAVPSDLAQPLHVGQRVIASHPKSRGFYEGSILTVERERCRIQFDSLELGVEFVTDIDCMPLDMVDNVPVAFRREHIAVDKDQQSFNEFITAKNVGYMRSALRENMKTPDGLISSPAHPVIPSLKIRKEDLVDKISQDKAIAREHDSADEVTQTHPSDVGQIQSGDADIQALSDLSRALDKKEALVSEIRYMNSEVLKSQNADESIRDSELFQRQYASVRLQLKEVSDQVDSSLSYLRQRKMYQESSPRLWLKPVDRSSCLESRNYSVHSAVPAQESTANVVEVFERSRRKAQEMVDAATQAMSLSTEGEDIYRKVGEALDYTNCLDFGVDSSVPAVRSLNNSNPSYGLPCESQATFSMEEHLTMDQATKSKLNVASETSQVPIPSALISSCVAAFLMIQTCSDRRYPPAESAEILESAIKSLQPCSSQNVPIYRDIQMCMGMVKNQILALIPT